MSKTVDAIMEFAKWCSCQGWKYDTDGEFWYNEDKDYDSSLKSDDELIKDFVDYVGRFFHESQKWVIEHISSK